MSRLFLPSAAAALVLSAFIAVPAQGAFENQTRLLASDGKSDDYLGMSVSVDGDTAVVGAGYAEVEGQVFQGAAYVFSRVSGHWQQTAKLTADDGAERDFFGTSVAVSGGTIAVGANGADSPDAAEHGTYDSGAVYTFERSESSGWVQTAKLTASDPAGYAELGFSVALDGTSVVAGAPEWGNLVRKGAVYTFSTTGSANRTQTAKLTASDGAFEDCLGKSVSVDGDLVAASGGSKVYTFSTSGSSNRTETAQLSASDSPMGPVAVDGDTIVAGADSAAYTFSRVGDSRRSPTATLRASDLSEDISFGRSVGIDGGLIVVGTMDAPGPTEEFTYAGAVYVFNRTGASNRTQSAKLTASDVRPSEALGFSVDIQGSTVIGDALGTDGYRGSAIVFETPADAGPPAEGPAVYSSLKAPQPPKAATAQYKYQWFANGSAISGATNLNYSVKAADLGKRLNVRVQTVKNNVVQTTVTTPQSEPAQWESWVSGSAYRTAGSPGLTFNVTANYKTWGTMAPGTVTIKEGNTVLKTVTLVDGKAKVTVSGLTPGSHTFTLNYRGNPDTQTATNKVTGSVPAG